MLLVLLISTAVDHKIRNSLSRHIDLHDSVPQIITDMTQSLQDQGMHAVCCNHLNQEVVLVSDNE